MSDPIVTHADLERLRIIRHCLDLPENVALLLERLIAAAEADAPPLPEGWVLYNTPLGRRALWHEGGVLYIEDMVASQYRPASAIAWDRVTPLRPTVTDADVERAAEAAWVTHTGNASTWNHVPELWLDIARAAFAAAGVEVQP